MNIDPNAVTAFDENVESEGEGQGKLYGYGKPMGGRIDGDVYINDDSDIFANGFGVEEIHAPIKAALAADGLSA